MKIRLWREVQVGTDENGESIYSGPLFDEIERLRGALEQVKSVFDDSEISDMDYALESYKIVCEALEGEAK